MPYIIKDKRDVIDTSIELLHRALVDLELDDPKNNMEGNLNYTITRLLKLVYGDATSSYRDVNDVVGMLECVKLEYYRKLASPYEDVKESENGRVEGILSPTLTSETTVSNS